MKYIDSIMIESVQSDDIATAKPNLLSLTRATTKLIYLDLVATQYLSQPSAALYGVKYLNPNGDLTFSTGATYTGKFGAKERESLQTLTIENASTFAKGQYFLYNNVVFKVMTASPFGATITATDVSDLIMLGIGNGTIRMVSDSADVEQLESTENISDARFEIRKWTAEVKTRKIKTELTVELAQDLEANGFDAPATIEDLLATEIAEETNKDIIQSLITVSKRLKIKGITDSGYIDLSSVDVPMSQHGRDLYHYICEMVASIQRDTSYSPNYVVASTRVASILSSSGWLKQDPSQPQNAFGMLNNGLFVFVDTNSPLDYAIVGVKDKYGDTEAIGSLFYAPYVAGIPSDETDVDRVGTYKVITDPKSLSPKILLMTRYALCVNPYTMGLDDDKAKIVDSTDLDNFVGQSKMSTILTVKLPQIVE